MKEVKYSKLRGLIAEKGYSHLEIAQMLGITKQGFCKKMKGEAGFKQKDVIAICNMLGIDKSDIGLYFYDFDVPQVKQGGNNEGED